MIEPKRSYWLKLPKGNEVYILKYRQGNEEEAIGALMNWAENPGLDFDWYDAAVLARQVTHQMTDLTFKL